MILLVNFGQTFLYFIYQSMVMKLIVRPIAALYTYTIHALHMTHYTLLPPLQHLHLTSTQCTFWQNHWFSSWAVATYQIHSLFTAFLYLYQIHPHQINKDIIHYNDRFLDHFNTTTLKSSVTVYRSMLLIEIF